MTGPLEDIHGMIAGEGPMSDDLVKRLRTPVGFQDLPFIQEEAADRIEALEAQLAAFQWQPIETAPVGVFVLCAHASKKWRRFGNYYNDVGKWYYSGTSERSQWSQVEGDAPTHWMPLPEPPKAD